MPLVTESRYGSLRHEQNDYSFFFLCYDGKLCDRLCHFAFSGASLSGCIDTDHLK
jgi:hypothetical protein